MVMVVIVCLEGMGMMLVVVVVLEVVTVLESIELILHWT